MTDTKNQNWKQFKEKSFNTSHLNSGSKATNIFALYVYFYFYYFSSHHALCGASS